MKQKNYNSCTVGQIVAGNFEKRLGQMRAVALHFYQ